MIETKLKELFKKYLDTSTDRPQARVSPEGKVDERLFDDQFYYNMEYLDWSYNLFTGQVSFFGPDAGRRTPFTFMGIFWGQENKIKFIQEDFEEYIKALLADINTRIAIAASSLRKLDVPPGKVTLTSKWNFLPVNLYMSSILGIPLHVDEDTEEGQKNKIESEPQYGRFILFE
jgi:hypothetical protein